MLSGPPQEHSPPERSGTIAFEASQALLYVLRSQPQTGVAIAEHVAGGVTQAPEGVAFPQVPGMKSQNWLAAHFTAVTPPQVAPQTPTAATETPAIDASHELL
jgi:hypothetical protein